MDNYTHRVKDIKEIRKTLDRSEVLSILEMKEYQKITEKLLGLQTDLYFTTLQMSKKNKEATISSLKYVKRVLKKVI